MQFLFTLVLSAILAAPINNLARAAEPPASFAPLVERLLPTVVNISTTQKVDRRRMVVPFGELPPGPEMEPFREFFERFSQQYEAMPQQEVYSLGSGFIIDEQGYIVTNTHVVNEAAEIKVILSDNTKLSAKLVGRDDKTDLALLKVEAGRKLPFAVLGDSDQVRVGDWVIAIGNPFGLGGTVTAGIISARARNINAGPFDDFLQTDAAINRGNSGGPMFNIQGEVVGINSAIFSPSGGNIGIGFAVPTALAKPVIEQLKQFGRTHRGWLGVKIQEVNEEIAESLGLGKTMGALVLEVSKDGPAAASGLQVGDVITEFDGKEVNQMHQLPRLVAGTPIGKQVKIAVWRNGKRKEFTVKLGELKEEKQEATKPMGGKPDSSGIASKDMLGMSLAPLTPELRGRFPLAEGIKGVLVVDVAPEGEAAQRGLRTGDVITQAGNDTVGTVEEFEKAVSEARKLGRKYVLLRVARGEDTMFITLPTVEGK